MKRLKILWVGACAAALAGTAATAQMHAGPPAPEVSFSAASKVTPFELFRGTRIFVKGTVNGSAAEMMLDSGAGMTVLERAFAEKIGVKGNATIQVRGGSGEVPGQVASGIDLEIGGLRLSQATVLILDMGNIERAIGRKIPVILGQEAFSAGLVTIDFPGQTIQFSNRAGFKPPADATRIELGKDSHLRSVKLSVAGLPPMDATLDIGNAGSILLASSYWKAQPKLADLPHAETQIGGVGGMQLARKVTLPEAEFAGVRFKNVPATFNEDPNALPTTGGNIGIEMLKSFVVTIDNAGDAMYLRPTGKAREIPRERAGLRTELAGDRLKVAYVSPDGPAAKAGLKVGDEIVAVDGKTVTANYYQGADWSRGAAGTPVALKRADGSTVTVTLADYY